MSKPSASAYTNGATHDKSYFEQQRDLLMRDISLSLENVLQNMNNLNRSLEGVIAVGNEFSSVEALWSHFENVMAKKPEDTADAKTAGGQQEEKEEGTPRDEGSTRR